MRGRWWISEEEMVDQRGGDGGSVRGRWWISEEEMVDQ